jgi:hypothetical protein
MMEECGHEEKKYAYAVGDGELQYANTKQT